MSLLGKLFGRSLEAERAEAEALYERGEYGRAKLAYERAHDLAKSEPNQQPALKERIAACCDAIARKHLAQADRYRAEGNLEFARDELRQARETAADHALLHEIEERVDALERVQVHNEIAEREAPSEEDRFDLIAGGFEDDQYAEYAAHGEPVKQALLQLHDGRTAEARAALEALIEHADAPRYLWFELGRARLAEGEQALGEEALHRFLSSLHPEEGGDARLLAEIELAQLVHQRGEFDRAVAHYESALTAMPDDPRPYLAMAGFFRREKLTDEAIEVLEAGLEALEGQPPDFRLWQELGLAYADAARNEQAVQWLERVVELLATRGITDLPPEGARRLAELYEQSGRHARALDLYSLLARGSDRPSLHEYHEQAARLMQQLGLRDEARRMLQRARELAPEDEPTRARIAAALEQLKAGSSAN